jgi:hypothetical protein
MIVSFGIVDSISPESGIGWQRANRSGIVLPGGGVTLPGDGSPRLEWSEGYETGSADPLPGVDWSALSLELGDVVPLYLHENKYYYGPSCGKITR